MELPAPSGRALEPSTPAPELVNCIGGATSFFGNLRVPAALLSGVGMGGLWFSFHDGSKFQGLFTTLTALGVASELSAVFSSTAASVKLLKPREVNPMAVDTSTFLVREMEIEYLSVRLEFFTGFLLLVASFAVRAWATLSEAHGSLAKGLVFTFVSVMIYSVAFFNKTCAPHLNFAQMWFRFLKLFFAQFRSCPISITGIACSGVAAAYFFFQAFWEELAL